MVDVHHTLAKLVRVGMLEKRLHEHQVVLLRKGTEMPHDRPGPKHIVERIAMTQQLQKNSKY